MACGRWRPGLYIECVAGPPVGISVVEVSIVDALKNALEAWAIKKIIILSPQFQAFAHHVNCVAYDFCILRQVRVRCYACSSAQNEIRHLRDNAMSVHIMRYKDVVLCYLYAVHRLSLG